MLNMLRFRDVASYSSSPELAPTAALEDSRLLPLVSRPVTAPAA